MLQTAHSICVCEVKCRATIGPEAAAEVREKIRRLKPPVGLTVRTVLIYQGALAGALVKEKYFDHAISFDDMLRTRA